MNIQQILQHLRDEFEIICEIDCNFINRVDLIQQINAAHRESYSQNQRIIIYYSRSHKHLLSDIQLALNVIDISNPFVCVITTDNNVLTKYNTIQNLDQNTINFYVASGNFELIDANSPPLTKVDILEILSSLTDLSDDEKYLLHNSKHFCLAPWIHSYIDTKGDVTLCCANTTVHGSTKSNTIKEIFYSDHVNNIKNQMLNDEFINGCNRCYDEEKLGRTSYRNAFNQKYSKHINQTQSNEFKLVSWDFRFNNLCNLACRSCGPDASTSWFKPAKSIGINITQNMHSINDNVFKQLLEHVDVVEEIYFAGGEPLIIKEHYKLLDILLKEQHNDVRLIYNTNLTETTYKGIDVFDLWNQFNSVSVCASLDAEGKRAEYLRCGTVWNNIVNNRKRMKEKCPNVYFWISATTGLINALHVPDFHRSWVEKDLINNAGDFNIQNIYNPEYMRVDRATPELKKKIIEKYNNHIKWLIDKDKTRRAISGFQSIIDYLENLKEFDKNLFWENIQPLDEYYNLWLLDVFPELDILPKT